VVKVSEPVCVRHVHTGSFLAVDPKIGVQNVFGNEFEVFFIRIRGAHIRVIFGVSLVAVHNNYTLVYSRRSSLL